MPSTYFSLHYHLIFGTKLQQPTIHREWRDRLHAYLGGCIKNLNGVPTAVGGVSDHVHLLVSLRATHQISEILCDIKRHSSAWVHTEIGERAFGWQDGYGAFTVSPSMLDTVRHYIGRQEEHHRTRTFHEEYVEFLTKHGVAYDARYLW
ncbi:IS200/IS605 family transposase [Verrucomicrobiota bacterium sgz303538]